MKQRGERLEAGVKTRGWTRSSFMSGFMRGLGFGAFEPHNDETQIAREALDVIADLVKQFSIGPQDDFHNDKSLYDSTSISAMADAMRLLAKHGLFEITAESGRRVIGRFKS